MILTRTERRPFIKPSNRFSRRHQLLILNLPKVPLQDRLRAVGIVVWNKLRVRWDSLMCALGWS